MKARVKKYYSTVDGRLKHNKHVQTSRERYAKRELCRMYFDGAVAEGKITKLPCFCCGDKAEAHHPDYDRPFDVVWLCKKHHSEAHRGV